MKNKKNLNLKFIIITIILCILSFSIGFYYGAETTISYGVDIMLKLIERQDLNISINADMLKAGISQYKNNIGGCLFTNAPVFSN